MATPIGAQTLDISDVFAIAQELALGIDRGAHRRGVGEGWECRSRLFQHKVSKVVQQVYRVSRG